MQILEFKIPNDPQVVKALADYLYRELPSEVIADGKDVLGVKDTPAAEETAEQGNAEGGEKSNDDLTRFDGLDPATSRGQNPGGVNDTSGAGTAPPPPTTETTTTTQADNDVVLDAQGLPWDHRIHAGSKTFMKSGPRKDCWKYKPGVDKDTLVPEVEAQLKAAQASAPATTTTETSEGGAPPPPTGETSEAGESNKVNFELLDPASMTFAHALTEVGQLTTQGLLDETKVKSVIVPKGIAEFFMLDSRPDLLPEVIVGLRAVAGVA